MRQIILTNIASSMVKNVFKSIRKQPFVGGMGVEAGAFVLGGVACSSSISTFSSLTAFKQGSQS